MKWPCAHCPIIAKHRYGHYYGVCDGCKEMEEYEVWAENNVIKISNFTDKFIKTKEEDKFESSR